MKKLEQIEELFELISAAKYLVFLGGAGVSTESGVPDFRSTDGLYHQSYKYPPEKILSRNFFYQQPDTFYDFYKAQIIKHDALPNPGHDFLKFLEDKEILKAVITQNIDGLHQKAGSKNVLELHGTVLKNHCTRCHKAFDLDYIKNHPSPVQCDECQALVKPDIVLYNEALDMQVLDRAIQEVLKSDLLLVAGTSLNVYPAAGLLDSAKEILLINQTKTSRDLFCDYVYYGKFGETAEKLRGMFD